MEADYYKTVSGHLFLYLLNAKKSQQNNHFWPTEIESTSQLTETKYTHRPTATGSTTRHEQQSQQHRVGISNGQQHDHP